jgi:superfamily II DNA helicase RecQ
MRKGKIGVRQERRPVRSASAPRGGVFEEFRAWRRRRAEADGVPAYVVLHDATLAAIAERRPSDWADLAGIPGIGPAKLDRYADEVLAVPAANR